MFNKVTLRKLYERLYVAFLACLLILWNSIHNGPPTVPEWIILYTLVGLLVLIERFKFQVNTEGVSVHLETVFLVGFSISYSSSVLVWAGLIFASISAYRRTIKHAQVFNAITLVLAAFIAKQLWTSGAGVTPQWSHYLLPIVLYMLTYCAVNIITVLIFFAISLGGKAVPGVFKEFFIIRVLLMYAVELSLGILLSLVLEDAGLAGAIMFTGLILLLSYAFKDYFKMSNHFKQLSIRDEITQLHNHRYIHSCMDNFFEIGRPFAALMFDIDHFRRYNEIHGHVKGDELLRNMSDVLVDKKESGADIARYSGEEFLMLIPDAALEAAKKKAEYLKSCVERAQLPGVDKLPRKRLTVSIGVATYPDMAKSKKDLLMMVDEALYNGKFSGRNKVSIYSSTLDEMRDDLDSEHPDRELLTTIKLFLAILKSKDRYTYAHTERDVRYAEALGKKIGLPKERLRLLIFGAFLHDIGKTELPLEVLTKRTSLDNDEWDIIRSHVIHGERIVKTVDGLQGCLPIVRHHHERFNGKGYPDGLQGEEISLETRILTIADSFDAMTTSRPYQVKKTMLEAFDELRICAGSQFDPDLVEPFIEVVQEIGYLGEDDTEVEKVVSTQ